MIEIDASFGEGGGQVLRSALALSVITGRPMHLWNIRARRDKPGLKPQHLKAVEAAAAISGARVQGAQLHSQTLSFEPGGVAAGSYRFDIGTAGSATLVLQTLFLPLSFAGAASEVAISGGTHVPWSPCYHYLAWHWMPLLRQAGFRGECNLERAGFYPKGGGRIIAAIRPPAPLKPLRLVARGALKGVSGLSAVANLDLAIAERQRRRAAERLGPLGVPLEIQTAALPAYSRGTFLVLLAQFEHGRCCYSALGAAGKPAESVADEAADGLLAFLESGAAVDPYLADQLLLPLAFVPHASELYTARITSHLLTNAGLVKRFVAADIQVDGKLDEPGTVRVTGVAPPHPAGP